MAFDPDFAPQPAPAAPSRLGRLRGALRGGGTRGTGMLARIGLVILALLLLYYPVGGLLMHTIDDNPDFAPGDVPAGGSRTIALMANLADREVNQHYWVANDPFFYPSALLDNMPNFQQGIMGAMARMAVELGDHVGRARGTSQADPDLERAAGYLKYPGNVWIWNPSQSLAPTASSEAQYRQAAHALIAYNLRLSQGQAIFDRRSDNLLSTLERLAADIGSLSATSNDFIAQHGGALFDGQVDDIYYANKGRMYAYYLMLRELGRDFENVLRERDLTHVWAQTMETFRTAAVLQPWIVMNGTTESMLIPNHLAAQGFYILRARMQLYAVVNILTK